MSAANGKRPVDTAGMARAAAAQRIASALVAAFEACEELGVGLSEVQKIAFVEATLIRFEGFAEELRTLEGVSELLWHLGHQ